MIKNRNTRYNKRKKSLGQLLLPMANALPFFAMLAFITWRILESEPTEFLKPQVSWDIGGSLSIDQAILAQKNTTPYSRQIPARSAQNQTSFRG